MQGVLTSRCVLFVPPNALLQVEFPVLPGDRLLLRLADVDVSSGYYRLYVEDRVGPTGSSTAAEASSSELEGQDWEQEGEGEEVEGELEDELQDDVDRALLSLEGALKQELQRPGTTAAGSDDDSDALSVASEAGDGEGVKRSSLAWRAAAAATTALEGLPDSPSSSSSSSSRTELLLTESPVGSFSSSEGSSDLRARL
jgi:hypothetical protein